MPAAKSLDLNGVTPALDEVSNEMTNDSGVGEN